MCCCHCKCDNDDVPDRKFVSMTLDCGCIISIATDESAWSRSNCQFHQRHDDEALGGNEPEKGVTDRFGHTWDFPEDELCPECGQPDSVEDCDHNPLTDAERAMLRGEDYQELVSLLRNMKELLHES